VIQESSVVTVHNGIDFSNHPSGATVKDQGVSGKWHFQISNSISSGIQYLFGVNIVHYLSKAIDQKDSRRESEDQTKNAS